MVPVEAFAYNWESRRWVIGGLVFWYDGHKVDPAQFRSVEKINHIPGITTARVIEVMVRRLKVGTALVAVSEPLIIPKE